MSKDPKVIILPDKDGNVILTTELIKKLSTQIKKDEKKDYLIYSEMDANRRVHYKHIPKDSIESYSYVIDLKSHPDEFLRTIKTLQEEKVVKQTIKFYGKTNIC